MALKRLVTSGAVMAMLGCSGGAPESTPTVPEYSGNFPSAPGPTPGDSAGDPGQAPPGANPAPSSSAAGVETDPVAEQGASEGQNPDIVGIGGAEEPTASNGGEASGESSGGENQAPPPAAEEEPPAPAEEEPPPVAEEPEPIVRPALNCGAPPAALEGGIQGCDVNANGNVSGQDWFLWYSGGSGCMTAYDNLSGAFTAQWNNPGDFLARIGYWFDETQTFAELGEIGADMSFSKQGSAGGFSFVGIYGWSTSPLVEYYIVEDSFGNGPAQPFGGQLRGNFTVDGAQYNVYSTTRTNAPSINGTADFQQFFSVRQNPRQCGHVSISEHFRQWQRMGMTMGLAKEAKILVEAGGGNGSITFTHANVTITPPQ